MGWAGANPIFDRTADALINNEVPSRAITNVLAELIDELRNADWDTLGESMDEYRDNDAVMAAFRKAVPDYFEDDDLPGVGHVDGCPGGTGCTCDEPD